MSIKWSYFLYILWSTVSDGAGECHGQHIGWSAQLRDDDQKITRSCCDSHQIDFKSYHALVKTVLFMMVNDSELVAYSSDIHRPFGSTLIMSLPHIHHKLSLMADGKFGYNSQRLNHTFICHLLAIFYQCTPMMVQQQHGIVQFSLWTNWQTKYASINR